MTDGSARVPVTVVVLTFNEERNLDACLATVQPWAQQVFVVDSGSTDTTVTIAQRRAATVVHHPFETHARQWQWALQHLPIETPWVLAIDADQQLTPALQTEISEVLRGGGPADLHGLYLNRRQIFRGRWIKHGGYYPKYLLKLFRRESVSLDESDLVDHHFAVRGRTALLTHDMLEDNRNEADIATWVAKHNRYAVLQARHEIEAGRTGGRVPFRAIWGSPDDRTRWLKQTWARMPLFVRPCAYFVYRYVFRFGFLDGREGFIFHVLQGFWYRLLVDINILEERA